jgi:hypothetical protein
MQCPGVAWFVSGKYSISSIGRGLCWVGGGDRRVRQGTWIRVASGVQEETVEKAHAPDDDYSGNTSLLLLA